MKINLNIFLEAIRECTDLKELTPTLVNTLIKRIDVHNSTKDEHGHKHVPIDIYFTAVGIINIPTEEELIAEIEREKRLIGGRSHELPLADKPDENTP